VRIDPVLEEQLAEAETSSTPVGVWGTLGLPAGSKSLSPNEVEELARRIVARAEQATGEHASAVQVYENLNTFSLDGPPELIRTIARQPEVVSIGAARRKESMVIEAVPTTPAEEAKARRRGRNRSR
jgi:hypothetical protein